MDWTKIPDLLAITALVGAFWSILRRETQEELKIEGSPFADSQLWLYGWILILIHFAASMGEAWSGWLGYCTVSVTLISLIAAAIVFMRASVSYRKHISSRWMTVALIAPPSVYILLLLLPGNPPGWSFIATALVTALGPLAITLFSSHRLLGMPRFVTMILYFALGIFLIAAGPPRNANGGDLALNAILFTVYLGCCIIFWNNYRGRASAGSVISIGGFLTWALVFVIGPLMQIKLPSIHIESEVWNLPKYVVAVGMMLLLLENQIERSHYLAQHDDLTMLANRRRFQAHLVDCIDQCKESGERVGLLQIDLDRFKQVNDVYGHHAGDLLLKQVAERMQSRIRRGDLLARTGGDEFSVILTAPQSDQDIQIVTNALLDLLRLPFSVENNTVKIGASIGAAVYPTDAHDASSLYIAADVRMYEEKQQRRSISA